MKNQRIAIVSTKQPGTNPRMRKNADALSAAGYTVYTAYPHDGELVNQAQKKLQRLPVPNIRNPLAVSPLSKLICSVLGWKTLVLLRTWRNRLRHE